MTEPDVTLTDYGLAVECAVLARLLDREGQPWAPGRWFLIYFVSVGVAALAGGTVHGFFLDPATLGARLLWPAALLALGVTAWASWAIGARLLASEPVAGRLAALAGVLWLAYAAVVVIASPPFAIAVVHYLPAALFLLVAFLRRARAGDARAARFGAWGVGLTLLAAAVQQAGLGLHPTLLSHNALGHVIQGLALLVLFRAARGLAREAESRRSPC
jgi:hypothetical protein